MSVSPLAAQRPRQGGGPTFWTIHSAVALFGGTHDHDRCLLCDGDNFELSGIFTNFALMNENCDNKPLKPVRITAMRQTVYRDLMEQYENPIEHTCDIRVGQTFVSHDAQRPSDLCESAWESMRPLSRRSPGERGTSMTDGCRIHTRR